MRTFALLATLVLIPGLHAQPLDGLWKSQGYGAVLDIQGASLKTFEVTMTTCVPGDTAQRDPAPIAGREATFTTSDGDVFFTRTGGTADHKLLHHDGAASDVRIDRLARLPSVCEHPTPNTPAGNFEVFSRAWAENYILFDQKKVDWDAVVRANERKVTTGTTPAELFDIFSGMIEPFHDRHTFISAPDIKRQFSNYRLGTDRVVRGNMPKFRSEGMPALLASTDRALVKTPLRKWCNGQLQYGHLDTLPDTCGFSRFPATPRLVSRPD